MKKLNLTEATILALEGKLLNEKSKYTFGDEQSIEYYNKIIDELTEIHDKNELKYWLQQNPKIGDAYDIIEKGLNNDNETVGQIIRKAIKSIDEKLKLIRDNIDSVNDYNSKSMELYKELGEFLNQRFSNVQTLTPELNKKFNLKSDYEDGYIVTIPGLNIDNFIDILEYRFNIKTTSTGRGGSWTSYNFKSADGIKLKIGYTNKEYSYYVIVE